MQRFLALFFTLLLFGCVDINRFVEVADVDSNTRTVEFEFTPMGETQISFVLRHKNNYEADFFDAVVKVIFEDKTYYTENVKIPIKIKNQYIGTIKGDAVDVKFLWRKNVTFQKKGNIKIVLKPSMQSAGWQGITYFGVEVQNALKID